jgi:DNA end-binding protein Ku
MPRAIWSGSISFGLVNIPVKLYNAVSRKSVSFNQIDRRTGARIRYRKVSAADEAEVSNEDIVKGYELPSGEYVLIDDDELATLDPEAVRTIDIEEFVDLADIDPIFYDAAYFLAPDKATTKPYALLAEAMERSQKVGIARFVMRSKQYLAAVRPKDGQRPRGRDGGTADRVAVGTVRARQVPGHVSQPRPRTDRTQGGG